MSSQTTNGKAFEYACLMALYYQLNSYTNQVSIEENEQFVIAQRNYQLIDDRNAQRLVRAANAAARVIIRLEPQLDEALNNIPLYLSLQTDAQGIAGDVRDILCVRMQNDWQIGISCKHNHYALKHSRLSDTIDFGQRWFNIPCSQQYFDEITPIFNELRELSNSECCHGQRMLWARIANKEQRFYRPILQAFMDELQRLAIANAIVPNLLIQYLVGRNDFYKVIADEAHSITRVEAMNIFGTLNRPSANRPAMVSIPRLHLPASFYHIGFKPESNNTVIVGCDNGWTISLRIHNASSRVEPSLKFDVQLISLPQSLYSQVEPW